MTKALSVVFLDIPNCATDRGLQFLRNWFKNKIPHHPASCNEAFFNDFNFETKFLLKVFLNTTSNSFKPIIF